MQYLREKLPAYMVPNVFVPLAQLPLTLNGKVDRKALPWPAPKTAAQPDRDSLEQLLLQELQAVVPVAAPEPEADFFDLGLDSSGLVQLQQRLSRRLEREVSTDQLLLHANVRELAAALAV